MDRTALTVQGALNSQRWAVSMPIAPRRAGQGSLAGTAFMNQRSLPCQPPGSVWGVWPDKQVRGQRSSCALAPWEHPVCFLPCIPLQSATAAVKPAPASALHSAPVRKGSVFLWLLRDPSCLALQPGSCPVQVAFIVQSFLGYSRKLDGRKLKVLISCGKGCVVTLLAPGIEGDVSLAPTLRFTEWRSHITVFQVSCKQYCCVLHLGKRHQEKENNYSVFKEI
jgi:hypothetical protein